MGPGESGARNKPSERSGHGAHGDHIHGGHTHEHAHEHTHAPEHAHAHTHTHVHRPVPEPHRPILVAGPEYAGAGLEIPGLPVVTVGPDLTAAVDAVRAEGGTAVVVPLAMGRRPQFVSDCARALRWLARDTTTQGVLALAAPLGTSSDLVAWLRSAIRRRLGATPEPTTAVLVVSPAIDPFADAELYRVARLAWEASPVALIDVAFEGGTPAVEEGRERLRRLGATEIHEVSAVLGVALSDASGADREPLLSSTAARVLVERRVTDAVHALAHDDDGLAAGAAAEEGHGYVHTHIAEDGTTYTHAH